MGYGLNKGSASVEGEMDAQAVGFWLTGVLSKPVPVVASRSGVLEWSQLVRIGKKPIHLRLAQIYVHSERCSMGCPPRRYKHLSWPQMMRPDQV